GRGIGGRSRAPARRGGAVRPVGRPAGRRVGGDRRGDHRPPEEDRGPHPRAREAAHRGSRRARRRAGCPGPRARRRQGLRRARRPEVEQFIIPSTWRELGFGIYGDAGPLSYRTYLVTGLDASGFSADQGIREGRQEGAEAKAADFAATARIDYTPTPGLVAGL